MPGTNLTRAEAQERASIVESQRYEVALDLTVGPETFAADTTIHFAASPGSATFVDLIADSVELVELNGVALDPATAFADSRVQLPGLAAQNTVRIASTQRYTNTGEGLHRFVDPADGEVYLYSQFEVPDSRRMFAVFEQPDLKATFAFTVTAPARWQVVSNQPTPAPTATGTKAGAQGSDWAEQEIATWAFEPTPVMSSYITALIAGPYAEVRSELTSRDGRTIPLGVFCRASLSEYLDADYIFEKTREGFAFFEEQFDYPYPFDKYDQLFVPEYNMGAMENIGAVTFTEAYVFRSKVTDAMRERRVVTILHELAHMWFGDLVTMRWWNDLWLNESFAEYMSTLGVAEATEWTECWTTFVASEKSWAYRQDQLPSTHPIVAPISDLEDVLVNFDGITYAKGASVLKQLVAWVGREPFMRGVHDYFVKHHHANTELQDLLTELEAQSGRDLGEWSKLWLETAGVNTLRPVFELDADGRYTSFAIAQSAVAEYPTIRPHRIAVGLYGEASDGSGAVRRIQRLELDIAGELTEVPELVGVAQPELLLLNDDDLTYAKIRLDERSLATAAARLGDLDDSLARALVWGTLWDATRDAEFPASRFVDIVLAHIGRETASTTLRTLLGQLLLSAASYVAPERRTATLERVADALWRLAIDAEPGSDRQFQFVKSFGQLAGTSEQLDTVQGLFDGSLPLDGLDIDTDLGWELLIALAAGERAGAAEIDARLAEDRTASGNQSAAHARAALPTAAAKQAAWELVWDTSDQPNAIVRATGLGFTRASDRELLVSFVDRFFAALLPVWESRSYQIVEELVDGFFPAPLANVALADATRAWLSANPAAPAALRRMITEHLAGVERAVRVQQADLEA
ncbi:aminopeptidase N [Leucobacter luti]|uniref:Aminopeptidase N n=1 Tax=Leucobacter luti TaxID=340320 RepID=A0A4Q7TWN3_9MICO|nr:aminopeptidase N [Leucobacter luti]MBL3698200.1 aminopeptidase N [Leucobacter luti]RZT64717.1 aminopeptidase N [Leucobacter luti]